MMFLLLCLFPQGLNWRTISTEHFDIHYYVRDEIANEIARIAEEVYSELTPVWGEPEGKTSIVVTDLWDNGNGLASVLPFNTVIISLSAMPPWECREEWLRTVISHEYSHIIFLSKQGGIFAIISHIFGKWFAPNSFLSSLLIEGFASFNEGGPRRLWDAILRLQIIHHRFPELDKVMRENVVSFPGPLSPYLYGYYFTEFLIDRYGKKKIKDFYTSSSSLPLEEFQARRAFGKSMKKLWEEFRKYLENKYSEEIKEINKFPLTVSTTLVDNLWWVTDLKVSTKGIFYVNVYDVHELPGIWWLSRNGKRKKLMEGFVNGSIALTANERYLACVKFEQRDYWLEGDVYLYDFEKMKEIRLSKGMHAKYVAFSPGGEEMVVVLSRDGTDNLFLMKMGSPKDTLRLTSNPDFTTCYYPAFSPDGKKIIFGMRLPGDYPDLYLLDMESGEIKRITQNEAVELQPSFTPEGNIIFSSDLSGIFNIYLYSLDDNSLYRLTNVEGAALSPFIKGDSLYFIELTMKKFSIKKTALIVLGVEDNKKEPKAGERSTEKDVVKRKGKYNMYLKTKPFAWRPIFSMKGRESYYGGEVFAGDPLLLNTWRFAGVYLPGDDAISFCIDYNNHHILPSLSFTYGGAWVKKEGWVWNTFSFGVALWSSSKLNQSWGMDFSYMWERSLWIKYEADSFGWYRETERYWVRTTGFRINVRYRDIEEYHASISPERGKEVVLGIGSGYLKFAWRQYIHLFKHTVLEARAFIGPCNFDDFLLVTREINLPLYTYIFPYYQAAAFCSFSLHFPIFYPERGFSIIPVYFKKVSGSVFTDFGWPLVYPFFPIVSFYNYPPPLRFAGLELRLDLDFLGYPLRIRAGGAWDFLIDEMRLYLTL
ncbi:hypothetical protein DRQ18_02610 [bacterium]|nr:MAG: hypothetical protein DRQ18_02610 [bacterium]